MLRQLVRMAMLLLCLRLKLRSCKRLLKPEIGDCWGKNYMVEVGTYKYSLSRFSPYSWSYESQFCIPCLNYAIHVRLRSLFSTLDSAVLVRLCVLWLLYESYHGISIKMFAKSLVRSYHGLSIKMFATRAEPRVPYWNIAILVANYHIFYKGNN